MATVCARSSKSQHDALAECGRNRGDADVDIAARDAQPDAAVLRQPLLGNVEARHHLDARGDRGLNPLGGRDHVVEHPVHAEADDQLALEDLDVNVAGAVLDRLREHPIDELDDRRGVVGLEQVLGLGGQLACHHVEAILVEIDHQLFGGGIAGLIVGAVDGLVDYFRRRDDRKNVRLEQDVQIVQRLVVGRVGDRDRNGAVGAGERQQPVLLGVVDRDLGDQRYVEAVLVDVRLEGEAILLRQGARQPLGLECTHLDQHVSEFLAGLLALAGLVDILRRDPGTVQQDSLDTLAGGGHQARTRRKPTNLA